MIVIPITTLVMMAKMKVMIMVMQISSLSSMSNNLFGKDYDDVVSDTNDNVGDDGKNENVQQPVWKKLW